MLSWARFGLSAAVWRPLDLGDWYTKTSSVKLHDSNFL